MAVQLPVIVGFTAICRRLRREHLIGNGDRWSVATVPLAAWTRCVSSQCGSLSLYSVGLALTGTCLCSDQLILRLQRPLHCSVWSWFRFVPYSGDACKVDFSSEMGWWLGVGGVHFADAPDPEERTVATAVRPCGPHLLLRFFHLVASEDTIEVLKWWPVFADLDVKCPSWTDTLRDYVNDFWEFDDV